MNKQKPILRWTIGPVHQCGFDILKTSVDSIKQIYGEELDLIICYNQLSQIQIQRLKKLKIPLFCQDEQQAAIKYPPQKGYHVGWKLYPPRLRLNSHEIFIDNDIVITKKVPEIEEFLNNDCTLLYQGLHGLHGSYSHLIPRGIRINSGIFGVPPKYNFLQEINKVIIPWSNPFDEQGIVAYLLLNYRQHCMIPLTKIPIIEPSFDIDIFDRCIGHCGYHFVNANKLKHELFYRKFKQCILRSL